MSTREWGRGYDEGYQKGWNDAMDQKPSQQEPVAFIDIHEWPPIRWRDGMVRSDVATFDGQGLFFAPPQRKPLTDEELNLIGAQWHYNLLGKDDKAELFAFARAIEAAHGIKGEA